MTLFPDSVGRTYGIRPISEYFISLHINKSMSVCKVIEFVCVKSLLSFLVSFVCIGYVRNRKDLSPA